MNDEHFEKLREGIFQELLKANSHFNVFWQLYAAPEHVARIRNVYLTFFVYALAAHQDRFCISISNLTKWNHQTSNFPRMLNYIKSSKNISKRILFGEIDNMIAILDSHEDLIGRIQVARDQYIAHNQTRKKHLGIHTTYKHEEGEKLLKDLKNILNTVSGKYDGNIYSLDVSPGLNITDMLKDLTEYRKERINRRRVKMVTSEEEVLKRFLANYENAILLIPVELREEFCNKIIRREEIKAYAPLVSRAIEFQSEIVKSFIQSIISLRFNIDRFGRRLILGGVKPEQVYAELLRGIFNT